MQTWHIPKRTDGVLPQKAEDIVFRKVTKVSSCHLSSSLDTGSCSTANRKRHRISSTDGVRSTLYNPVREPLSELRFAAKLLPAFSAIQPSSHTPQFVQLWSLPSPTTPFTNSKFGQVPFGSVLSYQQPQPTISPLMSFPPFPFPDISTIYQCSLPVDEFLIHSSNNSITLQHSLLLEEATRDQSTSSTWHSARQTRITASNFKAVCSRQRNFDTLADRLTRSNVKQTAAMKHGLDTEPVAAEWYRETSGRQLSSVGFVVNPRCFTRPTSV